MSSQPVLQIENLTVAYRANGRLLDAVRDFSLTIAPGQTVGLVGESGSGKTTIALTLMRYLPPAAVVRQGKVTFAGRDLLGLDVAEMRQVWGRQVALVPQDPLSSLNPAIHVGEQVAEGLRHSQGLSQAAARTRTLELLNMVRLPDAERVADSYPHQLSGGQQQRVMIAMALSAEPLLLIMDEPTTALDVTTQAAVLDLIRDLIRERQTAVLYVSHNLGVVAQLCDRVAVLYAGELIEDAPARDLFRRPLHPYTQGLLDSVPRLGQSKESVQLRAIQGQIPPLGRRPSGCIFRPRCPLAIEICEERPPLYQANGEWRSRCHRWQEIEQGTVSAAQPERATAQTETAAANGNGNGPVLSLEEVQVHFPVGRSLPEVLAGEPPRQVRAVDSVTLELAPGKTLGLVGESGSGKTTLARAIVGLVERTGGNIELLGLTLPANVDERSRESLRHLQIVFQNPEEALNPYLTVGESLGRPLVRLMGRTREEADAEVKQLLAAVRLPPEYTQRLPGELSGGEKQRVAVARAFAANPNLLIGDEPVTALDVSVQASILNLLNELQAESGNSMLFISHDLAVVGYLADEIAVIYAGHLMEVSPAAELFEPPYHPYTEALLSAIPLIDPDARQEQIRLEGDPPSQIEAVQGCPFHPRCPRFLGEICVQEKPPWRTAANGSRIYCHIPLEELTKDQGPKTNKRS